MKSSQPCDTLVGDNETNAWEVKCIVITCVLLHVVETSE